MKTLIVSCFIATVFSFPNNTYSQSSQIPEFTGVKKINGTQIYFNIIGKGTPLVIVHGGPGLAHNYLFEPFKQLSDNYQLIFYDQRGCGNSSEINPADSVNMDTMVEDLEQIRNEFKIDKLNLVGQSWGAIICIEYINKFPNNVNKLLLLEPGPGSNEYLPEFQQTIMSRLSQTDKNRIIEISQKPELKYNPDLFNEFMKLRYKGYSLDSNYVDKMHMNYFDSAKVVKFFSSSGTFAPYLMSFNLYEKMKNINCPVLIIHGENDPIPTTSVERMAASIGNCELHIIKNSGHFVHIEKESEYFSIIKSFLKEE